ncbi:hypothetical protein LP420_27540 [Massilia sp. B-10]|nr:hypothetical protein LP420_27540 [Massilia sp. B-10]
MDNQKTDEGNARNIGSEGSGSSMGKDLQGSVGAGIGRSASELHKSIDKAADAAPAMADRLATGAHAGVDKVQGALTDASNTVGEKSKQLSEAYKNFAETGRGYVRSSPATSVLVALAAGYTLSKLLGRRH